VAADKVLPGHIGSLGAAATAGQFAGKTQSMSWSARGRSDCGTTPPKDVQAGAGYVDPFLARDSATSPQTWRWSPCCSRGRTGCSAGPPSSGC